MDNFDRKCSRTPPPPPPAVLYVLIMTPVSLSDTIFSRNVCFDPFPGYARRNVMRPT